jgi:hypothetical protein
MMQRMREALRPEAGEERDRGAGRVTAIITGGVVGFAGLALAVAAVSGDSGEGYIRCGDNFSLTHLGHDGQEEETRTIQARKSKEVEGEGRRRDKPEVTGYIAIRAVYIGGPRGGEIEDKDGIRVGVSDMHTRVEAAKAGPSAAGHYDLVATERGKFEGRQFTAYPGSTDEVMDITFQLGGSLTDPKVTGVVHCNEN